MNAQIERHLRGVWMPPSHPDHAEPYPALWAEAAEAVGMEMLRDGLAVYTILCDNTAIADAVRELICARSRDITTIANHVEALREAVREAAREYAESWHDGAVAERYALLLRKEAAGNVD